MAVAFGLRLLAAQQVIIARFNKFFNKATPMYPLIADTIPSTTDMNTYLFMGDIPSMREWVGERVYRDNNSGTFQIPNKLFELSERFEKTSIADDKLGMYDGLLAQMAKNAKNYPDNLLINLLLAGETTNGWDGVPFFSTSHVWANSGTQSNLFTVDIVAPATPTVAEFKSAMNTAINGMSSLRTDQGNYFNGLIQENMNGIVVLIPQQYRQIAEEAYGSTVIGGSSNVILDGVKFVVVRSLTANEFYVIDTNLPKPLIYQPRTELTKEIYGNDSNREKHVEFLLTQRFGYGFGHWYSASKVKFT